jgi:fluoride exporter
VEDAGVTERRRRSRRAGAKRPAHLRPAAVAQVLVGGALGAAARDAVEQALPTHPGDFPLATWLINLTGAFVLGALLEGLARLGDDAGWRRTTRLTAGTGFVGAFTTYSTFAVESDLLVRGGHVAVAVAYVVVTVVLGLLTVTAGIAAAAGGRRRVNAPLPVDPDPDDTREGPR